MLHVLVTPLRGGTALPLAANSAIVKVDPPTASWRWRVGCVEQQSFAEPTPSQISSPLSPCQLYGVLRPTERLHALRRAVVSTAPLVRYDNDRRSAARNQQGMDLAERRLRSLDGDVLLMPQDGDLR